MTREHAEPQDDVVVLRDVGSRPQISKDAVARGNILDQLHQ